jgi:hypothetical protein
MSDLPDIPTEIRTARLTVASTGGRPRQAARRGLIRKALDTRRQRMEAPSSRRSLSRKSAIAVFVLRASEN